MSDVALLTAHLRGEHSNERLSGCTACEALPPVSTPVQTPVRKDPPRDRPPDEDERWTRHILGGKCECGCGETVGPRSRFRPGHDAKLKSRLVKAARDGDEVAKADLERLGWTKFI